MRITVLATGKLSEPCFCDGVQMYAKRLLAWTSIECIEFSEQRGDVSSDAARAVLISKESEKVAAALPFGAYVILLDPRGKMLSSEDFSAFLGKCEIEGPYHIAFVLGGPYGVSPELRSKAHQVLSFSPMTFPHQMARLLLYEQLYRAFSILRGVSYHK
jgi:23S rRNA (pseudouridine1915-N3)-methyltransferase